MLRHSFYRRGGLQPSVRLAIAVVLSLLLMVLDKRYAAVDYIKRYTATALYPLQWLANQPVQAVSYVQDLFLSKDHLLAENQRLLIENTRLKLASEHAKSQIDELAALKKLAALRHYGLQTRTMAEVVSTGRESLSNRMVIDKGSRDGVQMGDGVADGGGLLGQVIQVHPLSAEVNVVTDGHMVIPVMVARTGVRTLVYGSGNGLALRYFPTDADLEPNDVLVTSGLDSVYPVGVPVAKVLQTSRNAGTPYYKVQLQATAGLQRSVFVLVLAKPKAPQTVPLEASPQQTDPLP